MIRIVFDLERRLIADVQSLDRVFVGQEGSCDGRPRERRTSYFLRLHFEIEALRVGAWQTPSAEAGRRKPSERALRRSDSGTSSDGYPVSCERSRCRCNAEAAAISVEMR